MALLNAAAAAALGWQLARIVLRLAPLELASNQIGRGVAMAVGAAAGLAWWRLQVTVSKTVIDRPE